jgi:hypothetical protein
MNWKYRCGSENMAPISFCGDYVISHREGRHILSYRPTGKHIHVGVYATAEEAKRAAVQRALEESNAV